jgi:hypothetical protein
MANLNLSMSDPVIDWEAEAKRWRAIADALYPAARTAGCYCDYERTKGGVPIWFPIVGGGIGRKLIKLCARCKAIEMHENAVIPA